jgi:2-polyprenyl-6-hydroxyphenyl methylase/3-demethylubiquinone-9 3-methyltransferase
MTCLHEREVGARFDALEGRFKATVAARDVRLLALLDVLGPLPGRRILDLGCGKGRFATHLAAGGAEVVGLDLSARMIARAEGLDRVLASARRLPFGPGVFDAVVAVEVLQHVSPDTIGGVLSEVARVLRPGGLVALIDRNAAAFDARRPWLPKLALKWIDERRGRWMYPAGGPVREHWFWPGRLRRRLANSFEAARVGYLLSPDEQGWPLFRGVPRVRSMALWTARTTGRDL